MDRWLRPFIRKDLDKKIVLLSGPRQVGKTTLSKTLFPQYEYFNYDAIRDQKLIRAQEWNRKTDLIVFDEIHKLNRWKSWIKGIYDTEGNRPRLLLTGSAKLETFKKGGDSLAGRHFHFRLHPFTVREVAKEVASQKALDRLLTVGGFPEPFLKNSVVEAARWRASHLDVILRQDLLDLERVREIRSIEILISLLAERVGSTVSYQSLAEDIGVSIHTIKHWLEILERLYVIFRVTPYSKNLATAIKKESKYYFYDTGAILEDSAARLENTVATALLTELQALEDTLGKRCALHFLRDKQKNEVDFFCLVNNKPHLMVEVKWDDEAFSSSLFAFRNRLRAPNILACQVTYATVRRREKNGVRLLPAYLFLAEFEEAFTAIAKPVPRAWP